MFLTDGLWVGAFFCTRILIETSELKGIVGRGAVLLFAEVPGLRQGAVAVVTRRRNKTEMDGNGERSHLESNMLPDIKLNLRSWPWQC